MKESIVEANRKFKPGDVVCRIDKTFLPKEHTTIILCIKDNDYEYSYVNTPNLKHTFPIGYFNNRYEIDKEYIFNMEMKEIIDD